MRKPIILLVLFVILMVATLAWSVGRNRSPAGPGEPANCNSLPEKFNAQGKKVVDTDHLDGWKERCAPKKGAGLADRFARGVKLQPAELAVNSDGQSWQVPFKQGSTSAQQAVLRLASGSLVGIHAEPVNEPGVPENRRYEAQDQCLCQGTVSASEVRRLCSADWIGDNFSQVRQAGNNASLACPAGLTKTKLFFGPFGGRMTLTASGQAQVSSK
jgi:hypothetical protein